MKSQMFIFFNNFITSKKKKKYERNKKFTCAVTYLFIYLSVDILIETFLINFAHSVLFCFDTRDEMRHDCNERLIFNTLSQRTHHSASLTLSLTVFPPPSGRLP